MARKTYCILPLATALAALGTVATPNDVDAAVPTDKIVAIQPSAGMPNGFLVSGDDLLAFTVTQHSDGTVTAQHSSHSSHSSHASHASSRY